MSVRLCERPDAGQVTYQRDGSWRLNSFAYHRPLTLEHTLTLLANEGMVVFGGGTDLMVDWRDNRRVPQGVVDIKAVEELRGVTRQDDGGLRIGATTTVAELAEAGLDGPYTMLTEGAKRFACLELRYRATVGGNIANAAPCAQFAPPLLAAEGSVELQSLRGHRLVAAREFFLGVNKTVREPDELVTAIHFPSLPGGRSTCRSFRRTKGMDLSNALAVVLILHGDDVARREIRIALGSVATTPIRVTEAESLLSGRPLSKELWLQGAELLRQSMNPRASSLRASPLVKREAVVAMVRSALEDLLPGEASLA